MALAANLNCKLLQGIADEIAKASYPKGATKCGKQKILLVDDDPLTQRLLTQVLGNAGYLAIIGSHGGETLSIVETEQPDLIILDVIMPDASGLEALRRMKMSEHTH